MIHARKDYNRIQDPENKIPADEPVFLLRAQDKLAEQVLRTYISNAEDMGVGGEFIELCKDQAQAFHEWPNKKFPDIPNDPGDPA